MQAALQALLLCYLVTMVVPLASGADELLDKIGQYGSELSLRYAAVVEQLELIRQQPTDYDVKALAGRIADVQSRINAIRSAMGQYNQTATLTEQGLTVVNFYASLQSFYASLVWIRGQLTDAPLWKAAYNTAGSYQQLNELVVALDVNTMRPKLPVLMHQLALEGNTTTQDCLRRALRQYAQCFEQYSLRVQQLLDKELILANEQRAHFPPKDYYTFVTNRYLYESTGGFVARYAEQQFVNFARAKALHWLLPSALTMLTTLALHFAGYY